MSSCFNVIYVDSDSRKRKWMLRNEENALDIIQDEQTELLYAFALGMAHALRTVKECSRHCPDRQQVEDTASFAMSFNLTYPDKRERDLDVPLMVRSMTGNAIEIILENEDLLPLEVLLKMNNVI